MVELADFVTIGLTSGVVASGLTATIEWIRSSRADHRNRERDAQYLAARVSTTLEQFAMACANTISDADLHKSSGGHAGRESYSFPRLAEFPKDAEWKAIDSSLAMAIFSLHSEIAVGDYTIEWAKDVLDSEFSRRRGLRSGSEVRLSRPYVGDTA